MQATIRQSLLHTALLALLFSTLGCAAQADSSRHKDLAIVYHPVADVVPPQVAATGLKVTAWVDRRNNTYHPGEPVQLYVRTNRDAFVTVIDVGTSGKVHQIFPNAYQTDHFVKAHTSTPIPGARMPYHIQARGPRGDELIKVIASESQNPIIAQQLLAQKSAFPRIQRSVTQLAKDLAVVFNQPAHQRKAVVYNKVIHIR